MNHPPSSKPHITRAGLLSPRQEADRPRVPPAEWLQPARPIPQRLGRASAPLPPQPKSNQLLAGSHQHQPLPRRPLLGDDPGPLPRKPLGARGRWIIRGVVLAIILAGLFIAFTEGRTTPAASTPAHHQATPGQTTMPSGTQPTPPPTTTPAATPTTSPAVSPQRLAAQFLAAYFHWTATQSDQDYRAAWRALVGSASVADLTMAAPRLTLDGGTDSAATSPLPDIPSAAVVSQHGQARIALTWTIQVLPAGGELVQWQPRRIQATLTLMQSQTSWVVRTIRWTS
jgi:hypothetical protein